MVIRCHVQCKETKASREDPSNLFFQCREQCHFISFRFFFFLSFFYTPTSTNFKFDELQMFLCKHIHLLKFRIEIHFILFAPSSFSFVLENIFFSTFICFLIFEFFNKLNFLFFSFKKYI